MPYQFKNAELTRLNYLSTYPVSITGFAESLFQVKTLLDLEGFSNDFAIGDYHIKKNLCLDHSVVLFPAGISFWRKSSNQSSNLIRKNYRQFIETIQIDNQILFQREKLPLRKNELVIARRNHEISRIKLIVSNTLKKWSLKDFIYLIIKLKVPLIHLKLVLQKGNYPLNEVDKENPLQNNFHF